MPGEMTRHAERGTRHPKRARRGRDVLTPLIALIAVLAMGLVAYGQFTTARINREQAELLPMADGVATRVAAANVYLVQALGGDESVDVATDVFGRLTEAMGIIDTGLEGGTSLGGDHLDPVEDPALRDSLRLLAAQVDSFSRQATSRWLHRESSGRIGTHSDQELDALYTTVIEQTARVSDDLERSEQMQRDRIQLIDAAVLGILAVLFVGVVAFARRTRRAIVREKTELETRVRDRTAALARSEARTTAIVTTAHDAIITIDDAGTIRSINPATERVFGFTEAELVGEHVGILMTDPDPVEEGSPARADDVASWPQILGSGRETTARRKDGTVFPIDISVSEARVDDDRLYVGLIRDITERKRVEAELHVAKAAAEEAATHDPLTGLWNHNRIIEILIEEMARADRQGQPVSLAMLDLDHFKHVNDTYGHVVGDEVLREIARRLDAAVRVYDSVGRFGGEEFMIVFPGTDPRDAERAAERIRLEISHDPVLTTAGTLTVTGSLGVVTHVGELVHDATALLVAADDALYDAKESGRDRVTIASMQQTR
jgi:diguanylate cyclase (GGDEF)-like protein/PAS domain S-box-containing protein